MGGDYNVGRGKPPREWQFRKGQSGNPRGRPRKYGDSASHGGLSSYDSMLVSRLDKTVAIVEQGRKRRVPIGEAIIAKQTAQALAGSRLSANHLLALGRAAEQQMRAQQEDQFRYWRDWHRKAGDPPLHWPPAQECPVLPHPRDVYLDPVSRTVQFLGPLQREEAHLFRNVAIERDLCLCEAELARKAGRGEEMRRQHLGSAALLHELLAPGHGGRRYDETIESALHRLTAAAMEIRLLTTPQIRKHMAALTAMLKPALMPPSSRAQSGALIRQLAGASGKRR